MLVVGVLTLYTSEPLSQEMQAWVARMKATGRLVFLKPITELKLKKKKKAHVNRYLAASLSTLPLN